MESDIHWDAWGINQQGHLVGKCFIKSTLFGPITASRASVVTIILIGLRCCGSNDILAMTDDPRVAVVDD